MDHLEKLKRHEEIRTSPLFFRTQANALLIEACYLASGIDYIGVSACVYDHGDTLAPSFNISDTRLDCRQTSSISCVETFFSRLRPFGIKTRQGYDGTETDGPVDSTDLTKELLGRLKPEALPARALFAINVKLFEANARLARNSYAYIMTTPAQDGHPATIELFMRRGSEDAPYNGRGFEKHTVHELIGGDGEKLALDSLACTRFLMKRIEEECVACVDPERPLAQANTPALPKDTNRL
ncbi:MAG: hypothetical protein PHE27_03725 [Alphaproteobacteria bacterium]|nr:hypothetical protein [Alphaproteobacteria bacterium]